MSYSFSLVQVHELTVDDAEQLQFMSSSVDDADQLQLVTGLVEDVEEASSVYAQLWFVI